MEEKTRILVADDNQLQLAITGDALKGAGFDVLTVSQGAKVYQEVLRYNPHLVLLDIMMPGIDGIEICRNLKRAPKTQNIIIVIYSGKKDPDLMDLAHAVGADGFIIKSNDLDAIVSRIKEILSDKLGRQI